MAGRGGRLTIGISIGLLALAFACASSPCPPLSSPHAALRPPRPPERPQPPSIVPPPPVCEITPDQPGCLPFTQPTPRCLASDRTCGPEFVDGFGVPEGWPRWRGPHSEDGAMCLRASAPRYPVALRGYDHVDSCAHDGECRVINCGECASYVRPPQGCGRNLMLQEVFVPPDASPPPLTWCGCVEGWCTMFTQ
jgi:hypothetical protein